MNPYEEVLKVKRDILALIETLNTTDYEYFEAEDLRKLSEVSKKLVVEADHVAHSIESEF